MAAHRFLHVFILVAVTMIGQAQGFQPHSLSSTHAPLAAPPSPLTITLTLTSGVTSSLFMARKKEEEENSEELISPEERQKKQQLGAVALLSFGIVYDFFVTHHGVGFWDPNYIP